MCAPRHDRSDTAGDAARIGGCDEGILNHDQSAAFSCPRRHRRRRHRRSVDRLPPGQARLARRGAARAQAADQRHHLACRRARRTAAGDDEPDEARPIHRQSLRDAGKGDRAGDRLPAARQRRGRHPRRAVRGVAARRLDGQDLRPRCRGDRTGRHQAQVAAAQRRRRGRRRVPAEGRPDQPDRYHHGAGQGRDQRRRARSSRTPPSPASRPRTAAPPASSPIAARSPPSTSCLRLACGRGSSAPPAASASRCRLASISTSSPSSSPG